MNSLQDNVADEAVKLANEIGEIANGHTTAAVYVALSLVVGRMASLAERPDFDRTMELIKAGAYDSFLEGMAGKA